MAGRRPKLTAPQMAGDSPLLRQVGNGSVVILKSRASGKTLRSLYGEAQGIGGSGNHAQWKVHVRRPGVIALQNEQSPENWLAIRDGKAIGNGRGGPYCELIITETDGHVVLESVQYPGQHVGVYPNGTVKEPGKTGTGAHAQFVLVLHGRVNAPPHVFEEGGVVILESKASGKTLRSHHGTLQGVGGRGIFAQWKVHVRRPGVIALQNEHTSEYWLAIRDGKTIGNAGGGSYCELIVKESGGHVVLESTQYPGQHVGVYPNGTAKEPGKTGTGAHAQFVVIEHKKGVAGVTQQMAGLQLTSLLNQFEEGGVVILESKASGKTLRSHHGTLQGVGGRGIFAQWKVHVRRPGVIALQNEQSPENWLAIRDGKAIGNGRGGPYCELILKESGGHVVLESVQYPGQHVGVYPDGTVKEPGKTGTGAHAQFVVIEHKKGVAGVTQQMAGLQLTSLLNQFEEGSVVILESKASGKTLRSHHGTLQGVGGRGIFAQWKVHVRRPGVIALQNEQSPENWLAIRDGKAIGNGRGGPYCEFIVKESGGNVVLESVQYPGQHVGVYPDGTVKEPGKTGTGAHAQFQLIVHKQAPHSASVPKAAPAQVPPSQPHQPHPIPPSQQPYYPAPPPQNPAYPPPTGYQPPPSYDYPGYQGPPLPPAGYPGYQAPPPAGNYPGYQAPPPTGYPGYQAPPPTGYPGYQAPPTTGYPRYQAPPTTGYPGYQAPPTTGYPGYQAPPPTGYPGYQAPPRPS